MKKLLLLIIFCSFWLSVSAQNPTLQQKLYYTCKVWGFVKYYHSNVSVCNVNWDSVLIGVLPIVKNSTNDSEFNDALDTMLAAAGSMTLSNTYFPDTLAPALKRNRDFSWINNPVFRNDVRIILDTIKNNFRPHPNCFININNYTTNNNSYLILSHDNPELNENTLTSYPDEYHRILMMFKYWNVVRYLNPNNYILDVSWDTTLYQYILPIDTVGDAKLLYLLYQKITSNLEDPHVGALTFSNYYYSVPGYYQPYIRLSYTNSQYVIVKSNVVGIYVGDALISIDGLSINQWEDSLRPYISEGNISVFKREMYRRMLGRDLIGTNEVLVVEDSNGTNHTINTTCVNPSGDYYFFNASYYPTDSLNSIPWTTLPCDIGYVNLENLQPSDVNLMYNDLQNKNAIIFDIRNNAINTIGQIADLIFPNITYPIAKFMMPDSSYPGSFYYVNSTGSNSGNPSPYMGKVIMLINEITQSHDEFYSMILHAFPNSVKVGSQTAGADGNVSYWNLSQDIQTGFTSLGLFYPNGDSTQRIGIVPDSVVYPTRAGIRHGRDEVLEKALSAAGCTNLRTKNINSSTTDIKVFPNPVSDEVNIAVYFSFEQLAISLMDVTGKTLLKKNIRNNSKPFNTLFDLHGTPPGIYFIKLQTESSVVVKNIVKI